jgi:DNA replication and repair protein RecF
VLVGPNGRGKTNVLEALHRVAVGASHRVAGDGPLVREGAQDAVVRVGVRTDDDRSRSVDVQLGSGRTRAQVDGQAVRRAADALGVVRVVAFAPEDLALVRGDPTDRRRYLDQLLSQRRTSYAAALADYERVLRQRNTLLKDLRGGGGDDATLASWTDQLVAHGAPLVAARLAAVDALTDPVSEAHAALTGSDVPVALTYRSDADVTSGDDVATIMAALHDALREMSGEERRRGVTLVGPHRDELVITLDGLPARTTASQGEAWSVALACKVGSAPLLTGVGDRPVLLLDDVFSELDETRRSRVAALCEPFDQVLVTAAVDADVPLTGRRIGVRRDDPDVGTVLAAATPDDAAADPTADPDVADPSADAEAH